VVDGEALANLKSELESSQMGADQASSSSTLPQASPEERLEALELQVHSMSSRVERQQQELESVRSEQNATEGWLQSSSLFNRNFLIRALAVWVHYFVAQLIIAICLAATYFAIVYLFLSSLFG
jgi:Flp pilus assembly protein TadB